MADGICPARKGTAAEHCWHDTGITLTSYPGYAVEQCCYCSGTNRRSLAAPALDRSGHGPFVGGSATLSDRRNGGEA